MNGRVRRLRSRRYRFGRFFSLGLSVFAILLSVPGRSAGQAVRVAGRIVEETGRPLQGATVTLTGRDTTLTTGPSGTFLFADVIPGAMVLSVSAFGHQFRSMPLNLSADTILTIVMRPLIVTLDTMIVRGNVRIKGTAVDSAGEALWFARAALYPAGQFVEASNGAFRFDDVFAGPVTIVVEAMEHLPEVVQFTARRDTTIRVRMRVDSVAMRIMKQQVDRVARRSQAIPFTIRAYDRDLIERERRSSVGELVDRMLLRPYDPRRRAAQGPDEACVFKDDVRVPPGMLDALVPEVVERVEVYRNGGMVRVYTRRYVMSLMAKQDLPPILYVASGFGPVCS